MPPSPPSLVDDHYCFVCGSENPDGLRIEWKTKGRTTEARFTPERRHQGWRGLIHGGLLATLLDEAMTRLAWQVHGGAMTAEITVRYLAPAKIGDLLTIRGSIEESKGRLVATKAEILNSHDTVVASATGKAILIKKKT